VTHGGRGLTYNVNADTVRTRRSIEMRDVA
jgi:hypothetical protein